LNIFNELISADIKSDVEECITLHTSVYNSCNKGRFCQSQNVQRLYIYCKRGGIVALSSLEAAFQ
jgi:hypothetical protein